MRKASYLFTQTALHGPERTRQIERLAQAALPPHTLMRRAGSAVARLALALAPHAGKVWVVAGAGNNGGDGLDAAILLLNAGKNVQFTLLGDPTKLPFDASDAYARALAAGIVVDTQPPPALSSQDFVIDALLGAGANRAPEGSMESLIRRMNTLPCPMLAIDLPSGLDGGTGQPLGEACVHAQHTVSLLTLKPGLYTSHGRDYAGEIWFDDLGVDSGATEPDAWLSGTEQLGYAQRMHAQHKGSFGDVVVVGGAAGMLGAALLAARAAHATGAGRVYVSLLDEDDQASLEVDVTRPELMFRKAWWNSPPEIVVESTVVCGCGGGDSVRAVLPRLLSFVRRLVLDADALNAIAVDSGLQTQLRVRAARGNITVLTPHPLEAARLLDCDAKDVQSNRLLSAQKLSDRFRCVVVLKGSGSVIAAPGRVPYLNPTGDSSLATAGTGDVLAGCLGGRWAQATQADCAFEVAVSAAYAHGAAADAAGVTPLRAAELVEQLLPRGPR